MNLMNIEIANIYHLSLSNTSFARDFFAVFILDERYCMSFSIPNNVYAKFHDDYCSN